MSYLRTLSLFICFFISLFLSGCLSTTGHYLGALADKEAVTAITPVLDAQQHWEEFYVTVDSRLMRLEDQYRMTGWLSFSQHSRMMYARVADVELTLFLLDADNRVVDYRKATHFKGLSPEDRIPFTVTLPLVEQAVAYTFGYQVTLIDEVGASTTNWFYPRTRH